jgi:hypothetical protein
LLFVVRLHLIDFVFGLRTNVSRVISAIINQLMRKLPWESAKRIDR